MLTKDKVIYILRTNPRELIKTIIFNNPAAVAEKIGVATDYTVNSPEQINEYVLQLLDEGEIAAVNNIVQVPFNYDTATPVLKAAYEQLVNDRGATVQGRFLDSSKGLFVVATATGAGRKAGKNLTPQNIACACKNGFCGKTIKIKLKYIIGAIVLAAVLYFITKKNN
jgi:hypothetical protein